MKKYDLLNCYIIDSNMNSYVVSQKNIQELIDNKNISIKDMQDNFDIAELIEAILIYFKKYNKLNIEYIINYLNDLSCYIGEDKNE